MFGGLDPDYCLWLKTSSDCSQVFGDYRKVTLGIAALNTSMWLCRQLLDMAISILRTEPRESGRTSKRTRIQAYKMRVGEFSMTLESKSDLHDDGRDCAQSS